MEKAPDRCCTVKRNASIHHVHIAPPSSRSRCRGPLHTWSVALHSGTAALSPKVATNRATCTPKSVAQELKKPSDGSKPYSYRYIGALCPDFHRVMLYGGIW